VKRALVIMAGTTGCGKTTIADEIARRWPVFQHLEIDAVRKELAGVPAHLRITRSPIHDGLYSHGMSSLAYFEMLRRVADDLRAGFSVIADGAFRHRDRRAAAVTIGRGAGARTLLLELRLEHKEQLRRLHDRYTVGDSISDAPPEVLAYHETGWEPVTDDEADRVLRIDTMPALESVIADVLNRIESALAE
jgi:predicted kinase